MSAPLLYRLNNKVTRSEGGRGSSSVRVFGQVTMKDSVCLEIMFSALLATGAIMTLTAPGWLYWFIYQAGKTTNV